MFNYKTRKATTPPSQKKLIDIELLALCEYARLTGKSKNVDISAVVDVLRSISQSYVQLKNAKLNDKYPEGAARKELNDAAMGNDTVWGPRGEIARAIANTIQSPYQEPEYDSNGVKKRVPVNLYTYSGSAFSIAGYDTNKSSPEEKIFGEGPQVSSDGNSYFMPKRWVTTRQLASHGESRDASIDWCAHKNGYCSYTVSPNNDYAPVIFGSQQAITDLSEMLNRLYRIAGTATTIDRKRFPKQKSTYMFEMDADNARKFGELFNKGAFDNRLIYLQISVTTEVSTSGNSDTQNDDDSARAGANKGEADLTKGKDLLSLNMSDKERKAAENDFATKLNGLCNVITRFNNVLPKIGLSKYVVKDLRIGKLPSGDTSDLARVASDLANAVKRVFGMFGCEVPLVSCSIGNDAYNMVDDDIGVQTSATTQLKNLLSKNPVLVVEDKTREQLFSYIERMYADLIYARNRLMTLYNVKLNEAGGSIDTEYIDALNSNKDWVAEKLNTMCDVGDENQLPLKQIIQMYTDVAHLYSDRDVDKSTLSVPSDALDAYSKLNDIFNKPLTVNLSNMDSLDELHKHLITDDDKDEVDEKLIPTMIKPVQIWYTNKSKIDALLSKPFEFQPDDSDAEPYMASLKTLVSEHTDDLGGVLADTNIKFIIDMIRKVKYAEFGDKAFMISKHVKYLSDLIELLSTESDEDDDDADNDTQKESRMANQSSSDKPIDSTKHNSDTTSSVDASQSSNAQNVPTYGGDGSTLLDTIFNSYASQSGEDDVDDDEDAEESRYSFYT